MSASRRTKNLIECGEAGRFADRPLRGESSAASCLERTTTVAEQNDLFCEGFRALAYESLQCRNPRAPLAGLWVKRLRGGLEVCESACKKGSDAILMTEFMLQRR